jgi:hypothetical protein
MDKETPNSQRRSPVRLHLKIVCIERAWSAKYLLSTTGSQIFGEVEVNASYPLSPRRLLSVPGDVFSVAAGNCNRCVHEVQ